MVMDRLPGDWQSTMTLGTKRFHCGHCGSRVSSDRGYRMPSVSRSSESYAVAYVCHDCNRLSLFDGDIIQVPAPMLGRPIEKLPEDVESLHSEMLRASAVGAYSLVIIGGRKLLMHIAVSLGADEGKTFKWYVEYLEENHFTPPNSKLWVTKIKDMGNDSNHEILISSNEDSIKIMKFIDLLLTFNYEYADAESDKGLDSAE
jgi:DNA-directed RNA polymerase subunit RPC12/RpoP